MHPDPDIPCVRTLTADALFTLALTSDDEEAMWAAIERLRSIGSAEVFAAAVRLCQSQDAHRCRIGVDVIAQFGIPQRTYHEPVVVLLLSLLEREREPAVIESIAIALGHRHDARAIEPLLRLQAHADPAVRYGVVLGLLGHTDPRAVAGLIQLSADPEAHVRDWATFGLGAQIDTDTPAIRAALFARLHDPDDDTAAEAMVGLARRKDRRVIAPLRALLQSGAAGSLPLEAAAALADPALLPALAQMQAQWDQEQDWYYQLLEEAIVACTPR